MDESGGYQVTLYEQHFLSQNYDKSVQPQSTRITYSKKSYFHEHIDGAYLSRIAIKALLNIELEKMQ